MIKLLDFFFNLMVKTVHNEGDKLDWEQILKAKIGYLDYS